MKNNHQEDKKNTKKTTNYPMDSHKAFCDRCKTYNGCCPITGTAKASNRCDI